MHPEKNQEVQVEAQLLEYGVDPSLDIPNFFGSHKVHVVSLRWFPTGQFRFCSTDCLPNISPANGYGSPPWRKSRRLRGIWSPISRLDMWLSLIIVSQFSTNKHQQNLASSISWPNEQSPETWTASISVRQPIPCYLVLASERTFDSDPANLFDTSQHVHVYIYINGIILNLQLLTTNILSLKNHPNSDSFSWKISKFLIFFDACHQQPGWIRPSTHFQSSSCLGSGRLSYICATYMAAWPMWRGCSRNTPFWVRFSWLLLMLLNVTQIIYNMQFHELICVRMFLLCPEGEHSPSVLAVTATEWGSVITSYRTIYTALYWCHTVAAIKHPEAGRLEPS